MSRIKIGDKISYYDSLIRQTISGLTVVGRHNKHYLIVRDETTGIEYCWLASKCKKVEEIKT